MDQFPCNWVIVSVKHSVDISNPVTSSLGVYLEFYTHGCTLCWKEIVQGALLGIKASCWSLQHF